MSRETIAEQLGSLPLMQTIESRWADIIGAVLKYQQEHEGRSPSNPLIAHATGLSVGQVQHLLFQMGRAGVVHDKEGWPRRLIVSASALEAARQEQQAIFAEPKEEKKVMATVTPPPIQHIPGKQKKRESFLVNAKRFAQELTNWYDEHGEAPLLKDLAPRLGYAGRHTAGLSRITNEMVSRGWLHHKDNCQRDWVLTGLGRAVLFGEPLREDVHTDMVVRPQPTKVFEPAQHHPHTRMEVRRAEPPKPSPERGWEQPSPVAMVMRPKPVPPAQTVRDLSDIDTVDLVLELTARGFRVSR